MKNVPCRLYVILAREALAGVIFRRGPTKWTQIIKWNTDTDTFEPGQWFHGRIYEEDSDLSPDGTKLIYLAAKYGSRDRQVGESWTAVSKVPYLTALAFFPSPTAFGGGLFVSDDTIWMDFEPPILPEHPCRFPPDLKLTASETSWWRKEAILPIRLRRDGWQDAREKPHPTKPLSLFINASAHTPAERNFILKDTERNLSLPLYKAVWADWDQRGRLVYARDGKIFAGELGEDGEIQSQELADFNANKPEPVDTPDWAKVW